MEDDLNDIDLIDRFLNGELSETEEEQFDSRCAADPEFKKEVDVYRKIYQGIEQAAQDDELRKQLDAYYDKYAEDDEYPMAASPLEPEKEQNIRHMSSWRRPLYAISGIAASVCLAVVIYKFVANPAQPLIPSSNTTASQHSKTDSGGIKQPPVPGTRPPAKTHKTEQGEDSGPAQSIPGNTGTYAMTDELELPASAIRQATYPQSLTYAFNNGTLTLYGDPQMGLLDFELYKKGQQYYVVYNNDTYALQQTGSPRPFVKQAGINTGGTRSAEKINVQIMPVSTSPLVNPPFSVVLVKDMQRDAYYFAKRGDKDVLVLQGRFTLSNCQVVNLKKDGAAAYYVVSGQQVYLIEDKPHSPKPLQELSGLNNAIARLFNSREPVAKPVTYLDN